MCMETGKKIARRSYTRILIADSIIKKVEKLAERNKGKIESILKK